MALLSGFDELNAASATFSDWLEKTNQMIVLMRDNVITANTSGANTNGDAVLTGQFTANDVVIEDSLRGGNYTTSANLFITSNVEIQNTALLTIVWKDINVIGNANTYANLHVSETSGDLRAYGDAYVEQYLEIGSQVTGDVRNTTVDSLKITGANIEFNTYSSNSVGKIITNDDGSLIIDADLGANGTADSILSLRVDNKDSLTVTSGNVDFYDATGASVQARWEGAHDTNTGGLGIRKTAPEANTALDVDAEVRVDQLTVDGSLTSNVYVGNTNWTDGAAGHAHWVNIRKSDASVSGIGWQTTLADTTNHLDTVIKTIDDESLVISVDDTARGVTTADIDFQTNGVRRQTIYANGDVAFTNNGVDRVIWDASRGTQGYLRHLDNVRTTWGTGDDFNIYHNGSHSYIVDSGTGNTHIWTATNLLIQNATGTVNAIVANTAGEVTLYHNNTAKLQTNSTGIEVYGEANTSTARVLGDANFDGSTGLNSNNVFWDASANTWHYRDDTIVTWGDDDDFTIRHDGSHTYLQDTSGTGKVYLDTNNFIVRSADGLETLIDAQENLAVKLYYNNANKLETTNIGINIEGEANTDTLRVQGNVDFESDAVSTNEDALTWTATTRTFNWNDNAKATFGTDGDLEIYFDNTGNNSIIAETATGNLVIEGTNLILRATDDSRYLEGIDGVATYLYSPDNTIALTSNNNQVHITDLANTNTLRVRSTSLFEDDISIEGSTSGEALSWDKSANTLNFNDNNYATFGTSGDLSIYHDATTSRIDNSTGNIVIKNNADNADILIATDDSNGGVADYIRADGSSGDVVLYHYGTQKLATKSYGVEIEGEANTDTLRVQSNVKFESDAVSTNEDALTWTATTRTMNWNDNAKATFGTDGELEIYFDAAANNSIISESGTGSLIIQATDLTLRAADASRYLVGDDGVGTYLYSPDDSPALLANNNQVHITDLANTSTLRVRSTSLFEDDISIEGSTSVNTLTWDKSANTLNFDDNNFITMGTDADLSIYHTGARANINTAILDVRGSTNTNLFTDKLEVRSHTGSEAYVTATLNGAVVMYHNNAQKLTTQAGGITVTGNVVSDGFVAGDGEKLQLGASQDLQIFHEASGNSIIKESGGGSLVLQGNNMILENTEGGNYIDMAAGGALNLYYAGAAKLATATGGVVVTGNVVSDGFVAGDNERVQLGAAQDLELYHNGTASLITNKTGNLNITNNADNADVIISSDNGSGGITPIISASGTNTSAILYSAATARLQTTNTGVTVTGTIISDGLTMGNSEKVTLGTTMEIFNDGTTSYVRESGTGSLALQANGVVIEDTEGGNYFVGTAGGEATLYHNSVAKLDTQAGGITVTGNVVADGFVAGDNDKLQLGDEQDFQLYHSSADNHSYITENGAGSLIVQGNNVVIENTEGGNYIDMTADGAVELYYAAASKLQTSDTGVNVTGTAVSDGLNVDGSGYVSSKLHVGGTDTPTEAFKVTGTATVTSSSTLTGAVTFGSTAKPNETGQDLGDSTHRWDAFLSNTSVATYLYPATSGDDLGSSSLRWDIFGNDANINALTVNNNTVLGSDGADTLTVNAESDFNANATFTNIIVEGVANIFSLEIEVLTANGVAMLATETAVTATGDQEIDSLPFSESRGFKYIVQGRNENDATSAYGVEIMCVHNGTDVFFSRYGEISNSIDVTITPTTNNSHIILNANCPDATGTDIHRFNVVKIETT